MSQNISKTSSPKVEETSDSEDYNFDFHKALESLDGKTWPMDPKSSVMKALYEAEKPVERELSPEDMVLNGNPQREFLDWEVDPEGILATMDPEEPLED